MNLDIISVGTVGFDIFFSGKSLKPSGVAVGDAIVLNNGSTYPVEHAVYEAGGAGLNSAITFARQGIRTGCIARTGKDHIANQIKIIARHEGLEHELLINNPEHHTDMTVHIITDRANEINLRYSNSINSIRRADIIFPGLSTRLLYLAEMPVDFKLLKFLVSWAKVNGIEIAANICDFKGYQQRQINYVLASLDRVMMPIASASKIFNDVSDHLEIIRQLNALGPKSILLYDVGKEAYAFEDKTLYSCETYKAVNPLDMTGAEDVFAAGYTSAIFQKRSVAEALTIASANACSVMEVYGTRAGILRKPALVTMKVTTGEI